LQIETEAFNRGEENNRRRFEAAGKLFEIASNLAESTAKRSELFYLKFRMTVRPPPRFENLQRYAEKDLKGKQRRVVDLLIEHDGTLSIADIAADPIVNWPAPYDEVFNSMRKELNRKLKVFGLRVERKDNAARLKALPGIKKG
jgi:hypothetical protein